MPDAISELFSTLDKDASGSIDYHELEQELRRNAREKGEDDLRQKAKGLLGKREVVLVLGVPSRAKKALCSKLAYVFNGTWLSVSALAEREKSAPGSRLGVQIKKCLQNEPPLPIPPRVVKAALHAAVYGRADDGPVPALRGPFFLYDLPASLSELHGLEKLFGTRATICLSLEQSEFDLADAPSATEVENTDGEADGVLGRMALAKEFEERGSLMRLDSELETRQLLEKVVRLLAVVQQRRRIEQREVSAKLEALERELQRKQRTYIEAASQYMASSLREHARQTTKAEYLRAKSARAVYADQDRVATMGRVHLHHAAKQEYPSFLASLEEQRLAASSDANALMPRGNASIATSSLPSPRQGAPRPALQASGRVRNDVGCSPRTDLQLSPRNWREPVPQAELVLSRSAVRGVYSHS